MCNGVLSSDHGALFSLLKKHNPDMKLVAMNVTVGYYSKCDNCQEFFGNLQRSGCQPSSKVVTPKSLFRGKSGCFPLYMRAVSKETVIWCRSAKRRAAETTSAKHGPFEMHSKTSTYHYFSGIATDIITAKVF